MRRVHIPRPNRKLCYHLIILMASHCFTCKLISLKNGFGSEIKLLKAKRRKTLRRRKREYIEKNGCYNDERKDQKKIENKVRQDKKIILKYFYGRIEYQKCLELFLKAKCMLILPVNGNERKTKRK